MKIGITGASGLVGFNFCEKALSKGDSLNILIRKDSYATDNIKAQKFYGDLNNTNVLESFLSLTSQVGQNFICYNHFIFELISFFKLSTSAMAVSAAAEI